MKHKHVDMITAKANNMDLVVLTKVIDPEDSEGGYWSESHIGTLAVASNDFFLCLPQHKEAVFHSPNGGRAECKFIHS